MLVLGWIFHPYKQPEQEISNMKNNLYSNGIQPAWNLSCESAIDMSSPSLRELALRPTAGSGSRIMNLRRKTPRVPASLQPIPTQPSSSSLRLLSNRK